VSSAERGDIAGTICRESCLRPHPPLFVRAFLISSGWKEDGDRPPNIISVRAPSSDPCFYLRLGRVV
jgi:hypothetical protein